MKKLALTLALAAASLLSAGAIAQTKGEADPAQSKAAPSAPATAKEKADARQKRIAEGKGVAKTASMADDKPASAGTAGVPKQDRKAAAAKRKADAADAVKKGQTTSGEK